jgi:hypothetical protein
MSKICRKKNVSDEFDFHKIDTCKSELCFLSGCISDSRSAAIRTFSAWVRFDETFQNYKSEDKLIKVQMLLRFLLKSK